MTDRYAPTEIETLSSNIATRLMDRSIRPVVYPESVQDAIQTSLQEGTPLRCRMVLCPNWQVSEQGRAIGEIPVSVDGARLQIEDPSMKIVPLLSEEIPEVVSYLNRNGVNVQLLVVLADILSSGWVHDPKLAKQNLEQNQKAIKLLLMSSERGKEVFNNREKAMVSVHSQLALARNSKEYPYEARLTQYQMEALQPGTPMHQWYLTVMKQLHETGEYADNRRDLAGLKKIWERGLFLAGMYRTDGDVFRTDFKTAGFPVDERKYGYIGLGTVATQHGDIIAQGWNLQGQPLGVITPFNNAMEHSWSEPKKQSVSF